MSYRIQWTEKHDMTVDAPSLEEAIRMAMDSTDDVLSRKNQNLEETEEIEDEEDLEDDDA